MDTSRARSIRDIAHLYISSQGGGPRPRTLVVGAVDRGTFPGFHVAAMAAAMAALGRRVRVIERSGLLANAGRFLALPAAVYAGSRRSPVSALSGVELWYSDPPAAGQATVDIVHVPPPGPGPGTRVPPHGVAVVVARNRSEAAAGGQRVRCLIVGPAETRGPGSPAVDVVGCVHRWLPALSDVLPPPVRDWESTLSRAYLDCARRLLAVEGGDARDRDAGERRAAAR